MYLRSFSLARQNFRLSENKVHVTVEVSLVVVVLTAGRNRVVELVVGVEDALRVCSRFLHHFKSDLAAVEIPRADIVVERNTNRGVINLKDDFS